MPAPFPSLLPIAPGAPAPGAPGAQPVLTLPGAFAPTVLTFRGAALEFHPTLRTGVDYSDNFFFTANNHEDNFRTGLGPGFLLLVNGARTFGSFATSINLVHDTVSDFGPDVKVYPTVDAAIRYQATPRLGFTFTDAYVRNDNPATVDQFGLRTGRQTYNSNSFSATVDWLLDRVATQAYYRNSLFFQEGSGNNSGSPTSSGTSNTMTNILGVNASLPIGTQNIVRAGYEFSQTNALGSGTGTDSTGNLVFASFTRQFNPFLSGGAQTSFQFQTSENTTIWNFSLFGAYGLPTGLSFGGGAGVSIFNSDTQNTEAEFSANGTVSYRFARAVISAGIFQDFRQTGQTGQNFGIVMTRSYFGSLLYQLTQFISATGGASYTENDPTGTGNLEGSRRETTLTATAALNWQLLRWLVASAQYTWTRRTGFVSVDRTSNFPSTGDILDNRATLILYASF